MKHIDTEKLSALLDRHAEGYFADGHLGCAEIIINQCGTRLISKRYGKVSCSGETLPERSLFRIASMTKAVTAMAVTQQYAAGKLDLEAPLCEYIPGYEKMNIGHVEGDRIVIDRPAKNQIKVFHLLTHTSGIDCGPIYEALLPFHPRKKPKDTAEFFASQVLAYDPYTMSGYSESGAFDCAAHIVELLTGMDFGDYVRENITSPLGLSDTTFEPDVAQCRRFVTMHNRNEDGSSVDCAMPDGCVYEDMPYSCRLAGAGLASTAEDYSLFAEMLLRGGIGVNGRRIIDESAFDRMRTPQVEECVMPGSPERWGFGVRVVTSDEFPTGLPKATFGWSGAFGTHFWVDRENEITVVMMRNSRYDSHGCGSMGIQLERDVCSCLG